MSGLQERLDEARRQIRDRDKRLDRIRVILGAAAAETVEEVAERVISERNASWEKAVDVRDTLGAKPGEKFLDAARRVVAERDEARKWSSAFAADGTMLVATSDGKAERLADVIRERDAARAEADAARKAAAEADFLQEERDAFAAKFAEARAILGAADGQPLAVRARDLMAQLELMSEAAEGTPTMVFQAGISVVVGRDSFGNEAYAQVRVNHITDPMFLALSGRQYARLALCVVPEAAP
jgi:hypothetical protein